MTKHIVFGFARVHVDLVYDDIVGSTADDAHQRLDTGTQSTSVKDSSRDRK